MKRRFTPGLSDARRRQRGAVLIEFALLFPFLLVFTLAVVDISRAYMIKNMLHQAAREGVRTLVVSSADSASARVEQVMSAANVPVTSITYLGPTSRQMGVRVATDFTWLYPGLFQWVGVPFKNPMPLTAEAWMRQETP
jgi:Flp pilus assembly protein TadG